MADWLKLAGGVVLAAAASAAEAQEPGSVEEGYRLAEEVCTECHAIEPGDLDSFNVDAPPFEEVANTPGMTALALSVWFRTPHPTMPNFVIEEGEASDLIAYILSLKE